MKVRLITFFSSFFFSSSLAAISSSALFMAAFLSSSSLSLWAYSRSSFVVLRVVGVAGGEGEGEVEGVGVADLGVADLGFMPTLGRAPMALAVDVP